VYLQLLLNKIYNNNLHNQVLQASVSF